MAWERVIVTALLISSFGCKDRGACSDVPVSGGLSQEQCRELKYRAMGFDKSTARRLSTKEQKEGI